MLKGIRINKKEGIRVKKEEQQVSPFSPEPRVFSFVLDLKET